MYIDKEIERKRAIDLRAIRLHYHLMGNIFFLGVGLRRGKIPENKKKFLSSEFHQNPSTSLRDRNFFSLRWQP